MYKPTTDIFEYATGRNTSVTYNHLNRGDPTVLGILAAVGGWVVPSGSQVVTGCSERLPAERAPDKEHSTALARKLLGRARALWTQQITQSDVRVTITKLKDLLPMWPLAAQDA